MREAESAHGADVVKFVVLDGVDGCNPQSQASVQRPPMYSDRVSLVFAGACVGETDVEASDTRFESLLELFRRPVV